MELTKVILHNSISIDGSLTGFEPNMGLHYNVVGSYKPQLYLVGSNTVRTGIEMLGGVPAEEKSDFPKPKKDASLSYWVIPDTKGKLKGMLHYCRRYEFCKDVIVLISERTPKDYVNYLKERNYDYLVVGEDEVILPNALSVLSEKYAASRIVADTGRILSNLLIEQGLVSEVSLLIHPVVVGCKSYNMFSNLSRTVNFKLSTKKVFPNGYVWLVYKPQ